VLPTSGGYGNERRNRCAFQPMPMRCARLNQGFHAEEFVELTPDPAEASVHSAAPSYAEEELIIAGMMGADGPAPNRGHLSGYPVEFELFRPQPVSMEDGESNGPNRTSSTSDTRGKVSGR
jgi:hypothetical protein